MSYKTFNFESRVLVQETIDAYGYHPDTLGTSSGKFIVAICRFCGKPHHIRKGLMAKSGSACHKDCKLKEQALASPFANKSVREKSRATNFRHSVAFDGLAVLNQRSNEVIADNKTTRRTR